MDRRPGPADGATLRAYRAVQEPVRLRQLIDPPELSHHLPTIRIDQDPMAAGSGRSAVPPARVDSGVAS